MEYISDVFDKTKVMPNAFNLIVSGCGTGKTHFVAHHLLEQYPNVKPEEVLMVCSRSMIVKQQTKDGLLSKIDKSRMRVVTKLTISDDKWNELYGGSDDVLTPTLGSDEEWGNGYQELVESGINVLTYDRLAYILQNCNQRGRLALNRAKIIVFDECHALFADGFIKGIDVIRLWIPMAAMFYKTIFFGLTATPDQIYDNESRWGAIVNRLLPYPMYRYHVDNLIAIDFTMLADSLNEGRFPGKTITLCRSVEDCEKLHSMVKDSAILISKNHERYNYNIDELRSYICEYETLPDTVVESGSEHPLKHLFVTTTAREGFNLRENSGVKTIVCCYHDPINVLQIAGRARYDLDCLVVADMPMRYNIGQTDHYNAAFNQLFREFVDDGNDAWLTYINPILSENCRIRKINHSYGFLADTLDSELYANWIPDSKSEDKRKWFIYKKEQKQALVDLLEELDVLPKRKQGGMTFSYAMQVLGEYGYQIESCTQYVDRAKHRGYYISGGQCDKDKLSRVKSPSSNRGNIYPLGDTKEELVNKLAGGDDIIRQDLIEAIDRWTERGYSEHTACYAIGRRRDYVSRYIAIGRPVDGINRAMRQCAKRGLQKAG